MRIEEKGRKKEEEADEKAVEEERREKRKEGRRGRKEEEEDKKKNRESSAKDAPPNAFPSKKLGNNMTPIKGRLGKNTTPTHGDPEKLIQKLQSNPYTKPKLRTSVPRERHSPAMRAKTLTSAENRSNRTIIYKEAKAFGNLRNRSKFAINSH